MIFLIPPTTKSLNPTRYAIKDSRMSIKIRKFLFFMSHANYKLTYLLHPFIPVKESQGQIC